MFAASRGKSAIVNLPKPKCAKRSSQQTAPPTVDGRVQLSSRQSLSKQKNKLLILPTNGWTQGDFTTHLQPPSTNKALKEVKYLLFFGKQFYLKTIKHYFSLYKSHFKLKLIIIVCMCVPLHICSRSAHVDCSFCRVTSLLPSLFMSFGHNLHYQTYEKSVWSS